MGYNRSGTCMGSARPILRRYRWIDSCIADIVRALSEGGIKMRGSCCGHYKGNGSIELQDGRQLIIKRSKKYKKDI